MKNLIYLLICICLSGCKANPYTGKKNLNFYGNKVVFSISFKEYQTFLATHPVIEHSAESNQIKKVGRKNTTAAEAYFEHRGNLAHLKDYAWEYTLVDNEQRNVWCMPGGKIVFYSGILKTAQNEAGIAAIMGHEVAHALADHGAQRMSAGTLQTGANILAGVATKNQPERKRKRILAAYGFGSQIGIILPFNRNHETQADKIGVELMTIAGYDPQEAANLWMRMSENREGKSPPEILSTHPANERRIRNIQAHIPYAKALAKEVLKK